MTIIVIIYENLVPDNFPKILSEWISKVTDVFQVRQIQSHELIVIWLMAPVLSADQVTRWSIVETFLVDFFHLSYGSQLLSGQSQAV